MTGVEGTAGPERIGDGDGRVSRRSRNASRPTDVNFSRPVQRIGAMILFLCVVGAVGGYLFGEIKRVFLSNPELNGLIAFVFVVGVFVAFYQVFRLFSAVSWIEMLATRSRGVEQIEPPGLLVAMDPMRKNLSARGVGATTARSILDSVSARIDESRELLRYISGLLIFLGLLGTFWGLARTVPAVVDTIRAIDPQAGAEGVELFERLMSGLDEQLAGMGVAFASSLLGLAGSLVVGFLELMSAGALNRFYGELEAWLSARTKLSSVEAEGPSAGADVSEQISFLAQQMGQLNRMIGDAEERRADDGERLVAAVSELRGLGGAVDGGSDREALMRSLEGQDRIAGALERMVEDGRLGGGGGGMDGETRRHIRNIDLLLAKLIEELAAGRVETADSLRRELRAVRSAVSDVAGGR